MLTKRKSSLAKRTLAACRFAALSSMPDTVDVWQRKKEIRNPFRFQINYRRKKNNKYNITLFWRLRQGQQTKYKCTYIYIITMKVRFKTLRCSSSPSGNSSTENEKNRIRSSCLCAGLLVALLSLRSADTFLHRRFLHLNPVVTTKITVTDRHENEQHSDSLLLRLVREQQTLHRISGNAINWSNWATVEDNKFLFLHVGKAGGSSTHCFLCNGQDRFWCRDFLPTIPQPSYVSHYSGRCHMQGCTDEQSPRAHDNPANHVVFLATLRNPIRRIISAYNYETGFRWVQRTFPPFRRQCYPSGVPVQDMFTSLTTKSLSTTTNQSSWCATEVATPVLQGNIKGYTSHFTFNYQYYEQVFERTGKHLVVVRQEFFDEDLQQWEELLQDSSSSSNNKDGAISNGHNSISHKDQQQQHAGVEVSLVNKTTLDDPPVAETKLEARNQGKAVNYTLISKEAYQKVCEVLCMELQSYKRFLYRAENLQASMVLKSLLDLQETCPGEPLEVRMDHCVKEEMQHL